MLIGSAEVIEATSRVEGIPVSMILERTKRRESAHPRFKAIHALRDLSQQSMPASGLAFGLDHTSILHALCRSREMCLTDNNWLNSVEDIKMEACALIPSFKRGIATFHRHGSLNVNKSVGPLATTVGE